MARILVEQRVDRAGKKSGAAVRRQLMRDRANGPSFARLFESGDKAAIAGTEAVDAGEVGMLPEKRADERLDQRRIVLPLDHRQYPAPGEILAHDSLETLQPITMVAYQHGAGEHRDRPFAAAEEPAHQAAGGAARGDIVDAGEMVATGPRQIGDQRNDGNAVFAEPLYRLRHLRRVDGNHRDTRRPALTRVV